MTARPLEAPTHTPGPWAVNRNHLIRGPNGPVADVGFVNANGSAQCSANGRLIVAAPDLLAACELVRKAFLKGINSLEAEEAEELYDTVCAASVKARGGQ